MTDSNTDNFYAKIKRDTVEIFGQVFPLNDPEYFPTGELRLEFSRQLFILWIKKFLSV